MLLVEYFEILQGQVSFFVTNLDTKNLFTYPIQKIEKVHGGGFNFIISKSNTKEALRFAIENNIKQY